MPYFVCSNDSCIYLSNLTTEPNTNRCNYPIIPNNKFESGIIPEGYSKFNHLSIPAGLVIHNEPNVPTTNAILKMHELRSDEPVGEHDEIINDELFDKLYKSIYQNNTVRNKKSKKTSKRISKKTSKRISKKTSNPKRKNSKKRK